MSKYHITIQKLNKERSDGTIKTEIWTQIKDKITSKTISKRIWWKDDDGIYHDGTRDLPPDIRRDVDNAWIEQKRKW